MQQKSKPAPEHRVNRDISAKQVRLVHNGETSVVQTYVALRQAADENLDLVQITEATIPVVKILDYGKFKYEASRKKKEDKKKQRASRIELKELRFRPVTGDKDLSRLIERANVFLDEGNQVKLVCRFRGRENAHRPQGFALLDKILAEINGTPQGNVSSAARDINLIINPSTE